MRKLTMRTLDDLDVIANICRAEFDKHGSVDVVIGEQSEEEKQRSALQNSSLHKYCANISGDMNAAGYTQRQLVGSFKQGFELPVTPAMIKDIFREVGKAMFKKDSTRKLTTVEIQKVYEVVDARFGEITGIRSEWPSRESLMQKSMR